MDFQTWKQQFKPITNPNNKLRGYGGLAFETTGDDFKLVNKAEPGCVWTLINERGIDKLVSGYRFVNRRFYFVTENPGFGITVEEGL